MSSPLRGEEKTTNRDTKYQGGNGSEIHLVFTANDLFQVCIRGGSEPSNESLYRG